MIYNKTKKSTTKKSTTKKSTTKKTTTKKLINNINKTINVLSYNISWESMTGKVSDWKLCSNNSDKKHSKHYYRGGSTAVQEFNTNLTYENSALASPPPLSRLNQN